MLGYLDLGLTCPFNHLHIESCRIYIILIPSYTFPCRECTGDIGLGPFFLRDTPWVIKGCWKQHTWWIITMIHGIPHASPKLGVQYCHEATWICFTCKWINFAVFVFVFRVWLWNLSHHRWKQDLKLLLWEVFPAHASQHPAETYDMTLLNVIYKVNCEPSEITPKWSKMYQIVACVICTCEC